MTVATAVAALQAAIDKVGTLQGASLTTLAPINTAAQVALAEIDATLDALDASIQTDAGSVAGVTSGAFPPTAVAIFLAQLDAIDQEAIVLQVRSLVARVQINIAQATG